MKLFQIEEPEGGPADPNAPGAAVGIDISSACVEVAFSVGGNALILTDREGFEQELPVPGTDPEAEWQELLEAARVRAERALARPVTHAVIVLAGVADTRAANLVRGLAAKAGLDVLRLVAGSDLPAGSVPALAAAILAEDLAPRPD